MSVARHWRETPGRYNLIGTKCGSCGKVYFPRRSLCPECRRASMGKMESYKLKDEGIVFTYSIIHEAPADNNALKPYAVAMIMTDDGVLITGQLVDVDLDKVEIGMPVRAVLRKLGEDGPSGVINYGYKFAPKK
ncbi:MAG: Zn-ribbon domain-containing OB-fold protein [Methanomassiliicoccaceae archaeon]|nr:Zn-ribbon domain-containing OB-fold protein [Methanomassiliicoccaceae archaeon]